MVVVTDFVFTSTMRACRVSSSAASLQVLLRRAWFPGPHGAPSGGGPGSPLIYVRTRAHLYTQGLRRQAAAVCIYVSSYLHWRVRLLPVCSLSALCLLPARMVPVLPAPPSLGLHTQSSVIW